MGFWGLAQQAERGTVNAYVPGSNPGFPAVYPKGYVQNLYREKDIKNYMKKLSILVASVLGLALMASPAHAAPMTVATSTGAVAGGVTTWTTVTTGTSTSNAIARPVPEDNVIDDSDVVRFVATVDTGTAVTATATNATIVAATSTLAAPVTASSGSSSLTIATGTGTTATFYVYTKTTAIGTVVVQNGGTTLTFYVQGTAGKVNTVALTGNDSGSTSSVVTVTATATDVFGNKISGRALSALVVNGTVDTTTAVTGSTLADFGTKEFKVTLPTTGTTTLVISAAAGEIASTVAGFNTVTSSAVKSITVRDLAGELAAVSAARDAAVAAKATAEAALATANANAAAAATKAAADLKAATDSATATIAAKDAEIAKLKADNAKALADLKAVFNSLAKKWNAKFPKAKVTLVK